MVLTFRGFNGSEEQRARAVERVLAALPDAAVEQTVAYRRGDRKRGSIRAVRAVKVGLPDSQLTGPTRAMTAALTAQRAIGEVLPGIARPIVEVDARRPHLLSPQHMRELIAALKWDHARLRVQTGGGREPLVGPEHSPALPSDRLVKVGSYKYTLAVHDARYRDANPSVTRATGT